MEADELVFPLRFAVFERQGNDYGQSAVQRIQIWNITHAQTMTHAKSTKCARGSIQRPGWPGSSMKPKCR